MKTSIDRAGRVVIPAAIRERAGLAPGDELNVTVEDGGVRLERVAAGSRLVTDNRRHFMAALRHGMRVETPIEFLAALKPKR